LNILLPRNPVELLRFPAKFFSRLIRKKIKNISQRTGVSPIHFRVFTTGTGNSGEFFILNIKHFGKSTAGCAENICFIIGVSAFGTTIAGMLHFIILQFVSRKLYQTFKVW